MKAAKTVGMLDSEIEQTVGELLQLPVIEVADKELEAARWFHCNWLRKYIAGRDVLHSLAASTVGTAWSGA